MKEETIISRAISRVPNWALGACGTIVVLTVCLKVAGIDFANPLNTMTTAYATMVQRQADGMVKIDQAVGSLNTVIDGVKEAQSSHLEKFVTATANQATANDKLTEAMERLAEKTTQVETRVGLLENRASALEKVSHSPHTK